MNRRQQCQGTDDSSNRAMPAITARLCWLRRTLVGGAALLALSRGLSPALADSVEARCDIYPVGEDHTDNSGPCVFSQRQGFVTIAREDGVRHELTPRDDTPGNYTDEQGRAVYRQSGLGRSGLIFRFPDESVFVYWATAPHGDTSGDNPTAPYTTDDYDATTLLQCRLVGADEGGYCPAGILRMEDGQASIVITSPVGEEFTVNFMKEYVNAAGRQVEAQLRDDTWMLTVDGKEIYEVPLAAIEGG